MGTATGRTATAVGRSGLRAVRGATDGTTGLPIDGLFDTLAASDVDVSEGTAIELAVPGVDNGVAIDVLERSGAAAERDGVRRLVVGVSRS